jgi:hypothetical protein
MEMFCFESLIVREVCNFFVWHVNETLGTEHLGRIVSQDQTLELRLGSVLGVKVDFQRKCRKG